MLTPKRLILLFTMMGGLFLSACAVLADSGSWRYRMTVNVETPDGMKSGSAVREVDVQGEWIDLPEGTPQIRVKGEAVVIDMGAEGPVYALLKGDWRGVDHAGSVVFDAFPGGGGTTDRGLKYYSNLKNAKADLDVLYRPIFVRFKDPQDPTSVELVYSSGMCETKIPTGIDQKPCVKTDRFEEIYGKGVKLHSVTLEMTDDPVTTGIEKWLPWLLPLKGKYLHGGSTSRNAPLGLYGGDFSKGKE